MVKNGGVRGVKETFHVLAAPDVVEIPLNVAEDHEIEQAVVVQVHPGSTRGPTAAADSGFFRDVGDRAIAIVVIELVAAVGRHVKIFKPVVSVVPATTSRP